MILLQITPHTLSWRWGTASASGYTCSNRTFFLPESSGASSAADTFGVALLTL
jgi:hypothetical protein